VSYAHPLTLRLNKGYPGERVARPREPLYDELRLRGYHARAILAQQPIQAEEYGWVLARVDLQALLEPEDGGMFARMGPWSLLGSSSSTAFRHVAFILHTPPASIVSLSVHLSGLARGIERGASVTDETIIGYASDTGGPDIPVGEPHLHQAFYRYPRYNDAGSP
jgi:hypothetical protein